MQWLQLMATQHQGSPDLAERLTTVGTSAHSWLGPRFVHPFYHLPAATAAEPLAFPTELILSPW